ncbi:MAG: helix-turn-helix domain-containing protein [Candidatus Thorarchaeota archaeon]
MASNQLVHDSMVTKRKERRPPQLPGVPEREKKAIVHELDRNIYAILRREGPLTRSNLVSLTGIARTTLYDSLLRLIVKGYVTRFSEERKERGRPKVFFQATG